MSNIVSIINGELLTTSLSIADGTENQHKNVMSLIRGYQEDLEEFGRVAFQTRPFETAGGTQKSEYAMLNQHQATLLLTYMKNSLIIRKFKKALVKAFFDMESRSGFRLPKTFAEAMRLAADQAEAALKLESENQVLKPKAEALDRIATSDGSMCITNTAKDLQVRPKDLFSWLSRHKWIYRRPGGSSWIAYQDKLQTGYLEHKVTVVSRTDGSEKTTEQVRVTPSGLAKLANTMNEQASDSE